jgi:hypothetical protein
LKELLDISRLEEYDSTTEEPSIEYVFLNSDSAICKLEFWRITAPPLVDADNPAKRLFKTMFLRELLRPPLITMPAPEYADASKNSQSVTDMVFPLEESKDIKPPSLLARAPARCYKEKLWRRVAD